MFSNPTPPSGGEPRWARTIVIKAEEETLGLPTNINSDLPSPLTGLNPVIDGILGQRLKEEGGNECIPGLRRYRNLNPELLLESELLDLEIPPKKLEFAGHRDLLLVGRIERISQKPA